MTIIKCKISDRLFRKDLKLINFLVAIVLEAKSSFNTVGIIPHFIIWKLLKSETN